jgi:hypothetical protein
MTPQWDLATPTGQCAVTGRPIAEGETFYSVLLEEGESFRRVDFSVEAWTGPPEGSFCHFKSRMPVKQKRKKVFVDDEMLISFFRRLEGETEPARVQFRFVLALILMRKRVLKYDAAMREGDVDIWEMILPKDQSRHRVVNPALTDERIAEVSSQLGVILHSDMGDWGHPPAGDGVAPSAHESASS